MIHIMKGDSARNAGRLFLLCYIILYEKRVSKHVFV